MVSDRIGGRKKIVQASHCCCGGDKRVPSEPHPRRNDQYRRDTEAEAHDERVRVQDREGGPGDDRDEGYPATDRRRIRRPSRKILLEVGMHVPRVLRNDSSLHLELFPSPPRP